jgi:metal-sulfur cluster biosynthetic enzyme
MDEQTIAGPAPDAAQPPASPAPGTVSDASEGTPALVADDPGSAGLSRDAVLEALKNVYDPELGINIVDLGLVYDVEITDGDVDITYSLTTMGCPIGPLIEDQMRAVVGKLEGVGEIRPEMVLRPAWSPEMMTDEAKAALGFF